MKRQRGRNRRNNNTPNANRSMESNGPDVKVRGSAKQIFDKYEALARDAAASGNRVKAENLRQHAEHYLRIVNAIEAAKQAAREEREADSEAEAKSEEGDEDDTDNRSRRRYPPRARKNDGDDAGKSDSEASENNDDAEPTETVKVVKSTKRRKAPSRDPKPEETVADAAE